MDSPAIELSEKPFNHTLAVELRDRSNIENPNLNWISGDLFVSPYPPPRRERIFVNGEGSGDLMRTFDFPPVFGLFEEVLFNSTLRANDVLWVPGSRIRTKRGPDMGDPPLF